MSSVESIVRYLVNGANSFVALLIFPVPVLFITLYFERGVLISPIIIVELPISSFSSVRFCFMYFDVLLLGAYSFRNVMVFRGFFRFVFLVIGLFILM